VSIIGNSDGDGLVTTERTNCYLFHMNDEKEEEKMTNICKRTQVNLCIRSQYYHLIHGTRHDYW